MLRPRLILGLRIVVSVVFGILSVLLVELWVRSYWWDDSVNGHITGNHQFEIDSFSGSLVAGAWVGGPNYSPGLNSFRITGPDDPVGFGFGTIRPPDGDGYVVTCPYWFPFSILIATAIAPWLKWRFTLRTLLIATTLIAILLASAASSGFW